MNVGLMGKDQPKQLFIISPIGEDGSDTRRYFNKVQKYLISEVCEPLGYNCLRADQLDRPGTITSQVIECILDHELVVADLTGLNPNVLYELAIRHAVDKPVLLIAEKGTKLPFDIRPERVIFYSLDPEDLEQAKEKLKRFVTFAESGSYIIDSPLKSKIQINTTKNFTDKELMENMYKMLKDLQNRVNNLQDQEKYRIKSRYEDNIENDPKVTIQHDAGSFIIKGVDFEPRKKVIITHTLPGRKGGNDYKVITDNNGDFSVIATLQNIIKGVHEFVIYDNFIEIYEEIKV